MGENEHIDQNHAARARTCVEIADQVNSQLDTLLMYMRSDHIGMVHGDGELTRYMTYLCSSIFVVAVKYMIGKSCAII